MFKNMFTTKLASTSQKKFEDSDSSNSNHPKAKKSMIKSVTEGEFSRHPPDRENGKDSWGFWTKSSHFLGVGTLQFQVGHFHLAVLKRKDRPLFWYVGIYEQSTIPGDGLILMVCLTYRTNRTIAFQS